MRAQPALRVAPPYYDDPVYIEALAASTEPSWRAPFKPEVILASFHGVPKDYVDKGDPYPPIASRPRGCCAPGSARREQTSC